MDNISPSEKLDSQTDPMTPEIRIRRMRANENGAIHALVHIIADETFAHLFEGQVPLGEANWASAWMATSGEEMVGVAITREE